MEGVHSGYGGGDVEEYGDGYSKREAKDKGVM